MARARDFDKHHPKEDLLGVDIKEGTSDIRFSIHEQAYILQGIGERIQKLENMENRSESEEKSYQFTLWLRDKVEYCRNAALQS